MDSLPQPMLYRISDAMRLLSVSRPTIYRLINKGSLVVVKIGTATRLTAESVRSVAQAREATEDAM